MAKSVSRHVGAFVIGAEVVFINGTHDTELIIDVLQSGYAISHLDISLKLLVDDVVPLHPHIRLLIVYIVRSVFLQRNERLDWTTLHSDASGHHVDHFAVEHLIRLGQACNRHELDLENYVAAGVLDHSILYLESLVVLVTRAKICQKRW